MPALGRAQGGIRAYPAAACTNLSGPKCIPNTGGTLWRAPSATRAAAASRGTYKQATALEGFRVRRTTKSQVVVVSIEVQCFRQVRCVVATLLFGRHNLSKIFVQNKAEKNQPSLVVM